MRTKTNKPETKMNKRFKVNVGYDSLGREKNVYFPSLESAVHAVNSYFRRTKIVLSIVAVQGKTK